eukprot:364570-Chlamydomonas_euryale.AAC.12
MSPDQQLCRQVIGAIIGAAFLMATMPNGNESTLGSNSITSGVGIGGYDCDAQHDSSTSFSTFSG